MEKVRAGAQNTEEKTYLCCRSVEIYKSEKVVHGIEKAAEEQWNKN